MMLFKADVLKKFKNFTPMLESVLESVLISKSNKQNVENSE